MRSPIVWQSGHQYNRFANESLQRPRGGAWSQKADGVAACVHTYSRQCKRPQWELPHFGVIKFCTR